MLQQRLSSQRMQDFRQCGLHALSHAGGEDDYVHKPFSDELVVEKYEKV
jgi:CheY-like chemotaxis protein